MRSLAACGGRLPVRSGRDACDSAMGMSRAMDVPHGFDPTLILVLNLAGTFVFGLSGGLAAVRARLDLFGVVVLAAVVGLAGGITRDLLIGAPPATFRDWRYLAAAGAAGLVCFFARPVLERIRRSVLVFDAVGLGPVLRHRRHQGARLRPRTRPRRSCSGRSPASAAACCATCCCARSRPSCATSSTPSRRCSAPAVLVVAQKSGSDSPVFPVLGAAVCVGVRLVGLKYGVNVPIAPSERREKDPPRN